MNDEPRSIFDDVGARTRKGLFSGRLADHTRNWRECPSDYTLRNTIARAAEEKRGNDLHSTILDEEFRNLRQQSSGINGLRKDLHTARNYFLTQEPDLIRYVQVLFLEQRPFGTPESLTAQQQHCLEYAEFLQLDRLPHERRHTGLDRVLRRFFPDDVRADGTRLSLVGYELGEWRCSCGRVTGLARRYDHACPCAAISSHGRIDGTTPSCPDPACGGPVDYIVCPTCRTRVTLANLWKVSEGGTRPADYLLPLTLDLELEKYGRSHPARRCLMYLPLPIGLHGRNGDPVFGPPAVFWASDIATSADHHYEGHTFLGLKDTLNYDRRTTLDAILDALLRRTLLRHRGSYAQFTNDLIDHLAEGRDVPNWRLGQHTSGFWHRLRGVAVAGLQADDLVSRGTVSRQCTVASSPRLHGKAALAAKHLASTQSLAIPRIIQLDLRLANGAKLASKLPNVTDDRAATLEECGLVAPGSCVEPGRLLVGSVAPIPKGVHRTPEERLLEQIFQDHRVIRGSYLAMPGRLPGWVLDQQINGAVATDAVPAAPGRHHHRGGANHVTVTVAFDQPLHYGETLDDGTGAFAVVCGLAHGPLLRRIAASPSEPDLVVAPDHPWSPLPGEAVRTVHVRLAVDRLASDDTGAWSTGQVSAIAQQPLRGSGGNGAQVIEPGEIQWLVDHGARHLAMEIYGPRSDCADWRTGLRAALEAEGHGPLAPPRRHRPSALCDVPSHAVRRLDLTLRAARILPQLGPDRISLRPMTDSEVRGQSHGEVRQDFPIDVRSMRPREGGLFCQDIFGQDRHDECVCGRHHSSRAVGQTCGDCGRTLTSPGERARRFGHIELPYPVVHSWYLNGAAGGRLADLAGVTISDLRRLADCELLLVTDPGRTTWRAGQLVDIDEWRRTENGFTVATVTGGQAVQVLLRRSGSSTPTGLRLDAVVIQTLPVLPPDLRPFVPSDVGPWRSSSLNQLYSSVLSFTDYLRSRSVNDYIPGGMTRDHCRRLQHLVDRLLDNARQPEPALDGNRTVLPSLADSLTLHRKTVGPLREDLLRRSVDHCARAKIVIGQPADPDDPDTDLDAASDTDTVLLGRDLALRLVEPALVHALTSEGIAADLRQARAMIREPVEQVWRLLDTVCERFRLLVTLPHGPWRLVAFRVRTSEIRALQVQPGLLDLIGWRNLGESTRIFAILTDEANHEAANQLTIDALLGTTARPEQQPAHSASLFDLPCEDLADHLADAALTARSLASALDDGLILCDPDWLGTVTI